MSYRSSRLSFASTLSFVAPALVAGWIVAVGCGGEAEEIPNSSDGGGDVDGGPTSTVDGGGSSNTDASKPVKDAGPPFDAASIDAPLVDLDYGTCAAFDACGGTVDGNYKMTGGCASDEFLAQAKSQCPGLQESNVVIKGKGIIEATPTNLKRAIYATLSAKLELPCGGVTGLIGGCPGVENFLLGTDGITTATCTDRTGGGCNCDITGEIVNVGSAAYTVAGGVLTTDGEKYDFCSANTDLGLKPQKQALPVQLEFAK